MMMVMLMMMTMLMIMKMLMGEYNQEYKTQNNSDNVIYDMMMHDNFNTFVNVDDHNVDLFVQ